MSDPQNPQLDATYHYIQLSIGIVTALLPVFTLGIAWAVNHKYMDSISTTYYTSARNWLVASLCMLGTLFAAYQRRGRNVGARSPGKAKEYRFDSGLATVGGVSAVVVALVPTANCQNVMVHCKCPVAWTTRWVPGAVHGIATCVLLGVVALFCVRQFITTKSRDRRRPLSVRWHLLPAQDDQLSDDQRRAITVYRICGMFIVASVVLIIVLYFVDVHHMHDWNGIGYPPMKMRVGFIEWIALWAFGVAWTTRSKFLVWKPWPCFRDPNKQR
jgi:hypothetical protein